MIECNGLYFFLVQRNTERGKRNGEKGIIIIIDTINNHFP